MKIAKDSNLYEACERVALGCKSDGDRNLTSQDTATIMLFVVLNSVLDTGRSVEQLLAKADDEGVTPENSAAALKWRKETRDVLKVLATASNNFQNVVMADADNGPLMKSVKATAVKVADFA